MKRNISDEVDFEVSGHVARDVGPDDRLAAAAVVEPGDLVRRGRIGDGRKMLGSAGIHIRVDGRKIDFVGARREVCDYVEFTWCRVADGKILEDIGSRTTCKIVGAKSTDNQIRPIAAVDHVHSGPAEQPVVAIVAEYVIRAGAAIYLVAAGSAVQLVVT